MMFETRAVRPSSGRARVGFLHADVEAEEPQLFDEVGARRALAGVPTGRLPMVPASMSIVTRAFSSEKTARLA